MSDDTLEMIGKIIEVGLFAKQRGVPFTTEFRQHDSTLTMLFKCVCEPCGTNSDDPTAKFLWPASVGGQR